MAVCDTRPAIIEQNSTCWRSLARRQRRRRRRVSERSGETNDLGYVEGKNIHLEHRFPAENPDRFQTMARELVGLKPDAIGASRREFDWSLADGNRSKWKALGVVKGGGAEAFASCPRR